MPANAADLVRALRSGDLGFSESRHRAPIAVHAHENATITVLLEGAFEETYSGRLPGQHCLASTALFRPPGEPHADRFGREGALNLVVEIAHPRLEAFIGRADAFAGIRQCRDATVHLIAGRMHRELAVTDHATPLALEGLALELIAVGSRAMRGTAPRRTSSPAPWLRRVHDILHDDFTRRDLRIIDLAAAAGVHPVYLSRAFRAYYGVSPAQYLRQLRLAWSATALADSEQSIAEIALEAGFTDQSHFTRIFRSTFGIPPGTFRRSLGIRTQPPCERGPAAQ